MRLIFLSRGEAEHRSMWPRLKRRGRAPASLSAAVLLLLLLVVVGVIIPGRWFRNAVRLETITQASQPQSFSQNATSAPATMVKQAPINETNPITMAKSPIRGTIIDTKPSPIQSLPQNSKPTQAPPAVASFACPTGNQTANAFCASSNPAFRVPALSEPNLHSSSCPDYFRWIHEDLRPWKSTGITRKMVERAQRTANFRLAIIAGKAYVDYYRPAFQSREVFTIWGILQLLRRYPGRVPDLDLMFDCVDWPVIRAKNHRGRNASAPPPLFRYCGDDSTLDIVFPDWSFWGWPEINIKPWEELRRELKDGNAKVRWTDREPYAYWRGNPAVAITRQDLLKCNVSESHDWNARVFAQDWFKESREGFKESDLANQCNYRYKVYVEGSAWSVSEKYILACDSLTLLVKPKYYDFFSRGLMPVKHYWPIKDDSKCRSIKFAVDWGNSHKRKAQAIGKEASKFILEKLSMDYVYDYMFHLLSEYAKLLRYKPTVPEKAVELCEESMVCPAKGLEKKFMMESMVRFAHDSSPCVMPAPYSASELKQLARRKANAIKQIEMWEQRAWENVEDNKV